MTEEWSASRLRSWHRCPRRYKHEHIDGIDTGSSDRADFGTAFHRLCENRLREAMGLPALPDIFLADAFEQARLDALWAGYEARWDDSAWRVLGAEVMFSYGLDSVTISSHKGMDGLIQDADGRTLIVEHKTTGSDTSAGSAYYERLALDGQISIYMDAAVSLGYEPAGVLYDVAARPRHERKLATPVEDRTLTKGKGCKVCGGKAAGVQGSGKRVKPVMVAIKAEDVGDRPRWWCGDFDQAAVAVAEGITETDFHDGPPMAEFDVALVMDETCPACSGSGWEEAPRLHKGQRDTDESADEFRLRVAEDIISRPDDYFTRTVVTRTDGDMQRARSSILDTVKLAKVAELFDAFPMNDQSCFAYNSRCPFLGACQGVEDINDRTRFPLRSKP